MSVRSLAVTVSGVVVLAAMLYLLVQVRAAPAGASAASVDEAKAAHERTQAPLPSPPADPWTSGAVGSKARDEATRQQLVGPNRVEPPPVVVPPTPSVDPVSPALDTDVDLSNAMDEANRMFDRSDYEEAQKVALKIVDKQPDNIRMLRIVVSASCFMGDPDKAQKFYTQLPEHDRAQMQVRCARYGVTFKE